MERRNENLLIIGLRILYKNKILTKESKYPCCQIQVHRISKNNVIVFTANKENAMKL